MFCDFISSLRFSLFLDIINFFIEEKYSVYEIEYLLRISRIRLILFKSLEEVISSDEVSEESIVLRAVNEVLVRKSEILKFGY
jgi:hypothetical protein